MKMRVVSANVAPAKEKVSALCYRALGITAENVLADCKSYVPYDLGALQGSGTTRQTGSAAFVEWGGGDAAAYAVFSTSRPTITKPRKTPFMPLTPVTTGLTGAKA